MAKKTKIEPGPPYFGIRGHYDKDGELQVDGISILSECPHLMRKGIAYSGAKDKTYEDCIYCMQCGSRVVSYYGNEGRVELTIKDSQIIKRNVQPF